MICERCGKELPDNSKFCTECGTSIEEKSTGEPAMYAPMQYSDGVIPPNPSLSYSYVFIEPDEQLLGSLGNGWIVNGLFKKLEKCNALLTDKRLYLQGTLFTGSGESIDRNRYEKIIDLEDITGSGFLYTDQINTIMMLIIPTIISTFTCLVGMAMSPLDSVFFGFLGFWAGVVVDVVYYLLHRKTYFFVEYAGGSIRFDANILGISTVNDFQKQIRRAKDKAKGKLK